MRLLLKMLLFINCLCYLNIFVFYKSNLILLKWFYLCIYRFYVFIVFCDDFFDWQCSWKFLNLFRVGCMWSPYRNRCQCYWALRGGIWQWFCFDVASLWHHFGIESALGIDLGSICDTYAVFGPWVYSHGVGNQRVVQLLGLRGNFEQSTSNSNN